MKVVSVIGLNRRSVGPDDLNRADILFIDLDESVEHKFRRISHSIEQRDFAIPLNDNFDIHHSQTDSSRNYRKRPTLKLALLQNHCHYQQAPFGGT